MATDYLLEIDGIKGESTVKDHKGELDVLSWSWGVGNGVGGGPHTDDFHFTHRIDKASPLLMSRCAAGTPIPSSTLTIQKTVSGETVDYLKYKFTNCLVSSIQAQGEGGRDALPFEDVSFTYAKIEIDYSVVSRQGRLGPPIQAIFPGGGGAVS